jgi:hypothetical protein
MGPICTVMVYLNRLIRGPDVPLKVRDAGAIPKPHTALRVLTQPITLMRDMHCIRGSVAYFHEIKADRATPHPPTPRRPVR